MGLHVGAGGWGRGGGEGCGCRRVAQRHALVARAPSTSHPPAPAQVVTWDVAKQEFGPAWSSAQWALYWRVRKGAAGKPAAQDVAVGPAPGVAAGDDDDSEDGEEVDSHFVKGCEGLATWGKHGHVRLPSPRWRWGGGEGRGCRSLVLGRAALPAACLGKACCTRACALACACVWKLCRALGAALGRSRRPLLLLLLITGSERRSSPFRASAPAAGVGPSTPSAPVGAAWASRTRSSRACWRPAG